MNQKTPKGTQFYANLIMRKNTQILYFNWIYITSLSYFHWLVTMSMIIKKFLAHLSLFLNPHRKFMLINRHEFPENLYFNWMYISYFHWIVTMSMMIKNFLAQFSKEHDNEQNMLQLVALWLHNYTPTSLCLIFLNFAPSKVICV